MCAPVGVPSTGRGFSVFACLTSFIEAMTDKLVCQACPSDRGSDRLGLSVKVAYTRGEQGKRVWLKNHLRSG